MLLARLVGLALEVLHDRTWGLLAFAAVILAASLPLYGAVRLAVDAELREQCGCGDCRLPPLGTSPAVSSGAARPP